MTTLFASLRGTGPLYANLYEELRTAVLDGRLKPGAKLPSTRALAAELGVSRNVALLAYEHLVAEGYARGRSGSGTYIAEELPDQPASRIAGARPAGHTVVVPPRLSRYGQSAVGRDLTIGLNEPGAGLRCDFRY